MGAAVVYPVAGKAFTDPHGRTLVVESVDDRNIVLRIAGRPGARSPVLVVSRRTWNNLHMREYKRAS